MSSDEQRAAPHQIERRPDLFHERVLQAVDGGVEPGVDQQFFILRKAQEVGGVERVDLLLGLLNARAGLEARDVLVAVVVALLVVLLLRRERQRRPQHHVRVQEIEPLGHDADDAVGLAVRRQSRLSSPLPAVSDRGPAASTSGQLVTACRRTRGSANRAIPSGHGRQRNKEGRGRVSSPSAANSGAASRAGGERRELSYLDHVCAFSSCACPEATARLCGNSRQRRWA